MEKRFLLQKVFAVTVLCSVFVHSGSESDIWTSGSSGIGMFFNESTTDTIEYSDPPIDSPTDRRATSGTSDSGARGSLTPTHGAIIALVILVGLIVATSIVIIVLLCQKRKKVKQIVKWKEGIVELMEVNNSEEQGSSGGDKTECEGGDVDKKDVNEDTDVGSSKDGHGTSTKEKGGDKNTDEANGNMDDGDENKDESGVDGEKEKQDTKQDEGEVASAIGLKEMKTEEVEDRKQEKEEQASATTADTQPETTGEDVPPKQEVPLALEHQDPDCSTDVGTTVRAESEETNTEVKTTGETLEQHSQDHDATAKQEGEESKSPPTDTSDNNKEDVER